MLQAGSGISHWTDERGKDVEIRQFFNYFYTDNEVRELSVKYESWRCKGEQQLSTLGECEAECLVAGLLALAIFNQGSGFVGVLKSELAAFFKQGGEGESWSLDGLARAGYLREKWIAGKLVIFPTEKLVENQRVPKRRGY